MERIPSSKRKTEDCALIRRGKKGGVEGKKERVRGQNSFVTEKREGKGKGGQKMAPRR